MNRAFHLTAWFLTAFLPARCIGEFQKFIDEDSEIQFVLENSNIDNPDYAAFTRILTFSFTFKIDRKGRYEIFQGNGCSEGVVQSLGLKGELVKGVTTTVEVNLSMDDVTTYGKDFTFCVEDKASYKKASVVKNFSAGLTAVLDPIVETFNEGGNSAIDSSMSGEFYLFQSSWTGNAAGSGSTGTDNPFTHAFFIDPNDSYKVKYFVVDKGHHRVLIFNSIPQASGTAADIVLGQANFSGISENAGLGSTTNAGFNDPTHVAVTAKGILFITDFDNNRVVGFNTVPTTNGKTADFVLGQDNLTSGGANGAASLASQLRNPYAVYAIQGKLYIVDQGNNRVVVHNTIPTANADGDFVIGQPDFTVKVSGSDFTSVDSYLWSPFTLATDSGNLYLTDTGNHRVLVFNSIPTVANTKPNFVIGQTDAIENSPNQGGSTSANTLSTPRGLSIQNNRLAVADQANNRVLFYNLPITVNNTAATHKIGQGFATTCLLCTFSGSGNNKNYFLSPRSVILDGNYIWVADGGNNRVHRLSVP